MGLGQLRWLADAYWSFMARAVSCLQSLMPLLNMGLRGRGLDQHPPLSPPGDVREPASPPPPPPTFLYHLSPGLQLGVYYSVCCSAVLRISPGPGARWAGSHTSTLPLNYPHPSPSTTHFGLWGGSLSLLQVSTYLERRMIQFWALRPSMTDSSLTLREVM